MIVKVKEYSPKTGRGIVVDPRGNETEFSYKQLKDQKMIPPGGKANMVGRSLSPSGRTKSIWFHVLETIFKIRGKLWQ